MKKIKGYIFILILLPVVSIAATVGVGENYSLRKGEIVSSNLYAVGANTTVAGEVTGDVFAGGLNVFVGGSSIGEDVLVLADTTHLVSNVGGDVKVAARRAYLGGEINGDAAIAALSVEILPQARISGDLIVAGGVVSVQGEISGNARIAGGKVFINERIQGDAHIVSDSLALGPNASIEGSLFYSGSEPAFLEGGATIVGETQFSQIQTRTRAERFVPTIWGTWIIIRFAILLLFALAAHGILRAISTRFVNVSIHDPWWSMLRGFLVILAVPVAAVIGVLTFIGIPFSLFALSLYGIIVILSAVYSPIILGSLLFMLMHRTKEIVVSWKTIVLGVVASTLLGFIPYLGGLLWYLLLLIALGSIYQVIFDKFREVR